jgi:GT2 family glycosyltransferase
VRLGVVVPCYRQERFLPRMAAAVERGLAGHDWRGVLVLADPDTAPGGEPERLAQTGRWTVVRAGELPERPDDRPLTPGAARMAGFARAGGDWVLFVDADVEMESAWLARALAEAERTPGGARGLAGMWGRIEEWMTEGEREWRGSPDMYRVGDSEHPSDYLATLALYRRDALQSAGGYDARLNSEEDYELGMRLTALGYELRALPPLAAKHWSGPRPSFAELGRRWGAGLCFGQGQVLRVYLGRRGFARLLRRNALYLGTLGLWSLGLLATGIAIGRGQAWPLLAWLPLPLAALAAMALRKRSLRLGLHSLLSWTENGLGMLVGFFAVRPPLGAKVEEAS